MNNQQQQPHYAAPTFLTSVAFFILVVAVEAFFLNLVWNHVVTVAFGVTQMAFGHMFIMVATIKVFFRDILSVGPVLEEIREIQYFAAKNASRVIPEEPKNLGAVDDGDK